MRNKEYHNNKLELFIKQLFSCLIFSLFSLFCVPSYSMAEEFGKSPFQVMYSDFELAKQNSIKVSFFFSNNNVHQIERYLKDGTKIEMSVDILLSEKGLLFDPNIAETNQIHLLQYDTLTREFVFTHDNGQLYRFKSIEELFMYIFYPLSYEFKLEQVKQREIYKVEMQLGLKHSTIPPWIENVLFFWDWDIVSTEYDFDFVVPRTLE